MEEQYESAHDRERGRALEHTSIRLYLYRDNCVENSIPLSAVEESGTSNNVATF